MLIEFSVENFGCFRDRQTISMVASKDTTERDENVFRPGENDSELLHSSVIYGANASGKSTLISAMFFMKNMVLHSVKKGNDESEIDNLDPFKFSEETLSQPSEFEILFLHVGIKYQYGFSATSRRIHAEWLIAFPEGRAQRWFDRQFDSETGSELWHFGSKFLGQKAVIKDSTRPNALFLSTGNMLNHAQLKPLARWFHTHFKILTNSNLNPRYSIEMCLKQDRREMIQEFLNKAGIGVETVHVEKVTVDENALASVEDENGRELLGNFLGEEFVDLAFNYTVDANGMKASIDFLKESAGTKKMFSFAGPLIDVLNNGRVLIIDELNVHLHPLLTEYLVKLFKSKNNKNNAQLLFTTHDTFLLNANLFRRDQVWITEKNPATLGSTLIPLTDFHPRKTESIEKGYLRGRYGGVPYLAESVD